MNKILNILSVIGSFLIVFGLLFLIQDLTIGKLEVFQHVIILQIIKVKYLLFTVTSLLFITKFISFQVPNRR
jgi:hypothetical protein